VSERRGAAVRVPPPLVAVLVVAGGWALQHFWPLFADFAPGVPLRYWIGGSIVGVAFVVLGAAPLRQFRRTGQHPAPWTHTPELIIDGAYRYTRNPMYLMMIIACFGFSILLGSFWILLLTPVGAIVIYLTAIRHEEAYLVAQFGDDYRQYCRQVRRWL